MSGLAATLLVLLTGCGDNNGTETTEPTPGADLRAEALRLEAEEKARREREAAELDRLIAAMQPVYAELEAVRTATAKLHDRLTRRLRRQAMPPEHGAEITRIMSEVLYQLRTPRQLGAFKGVEEVQAELERARRAATELARVDAWVPEQR
jgi:hypothetical protein